MKKVFDSKKFEENLEKTLKPLFDEFNLTLTLFEFRQNLRQAIGD